MRLTRCAGQGRPGTLFLLLLVTGALLIGMHLGRRVAEQGNAAAEPAGANVAALQRALKDARAELEMNTTRHEVDRQSLEMVRAELASQKQEIAALEEDLRFYRGLMAPEAASAQISLESPDIRRGVAPGQYTYRIMVLQRARKHELARGSIEVAIAGMGSDGPVSYPLQELSDTVTDASLELGFRYFQAVEGAMALPEGFTPLAVEVAVSMQKPDKLDFTERYPWPLEE